MNQPMMYETHSHTPLCNHARGEPTEYAAVAEQRGLKGLIVTCHNPMPDGFSASVRMSIDEFELYLQMVDQARRQWSGRIDVRLGLEADYFPGYEPWLTRQLRAANFDYVLGSVHPQLKEFRDRFGDDDPTTVQRTYFSLLADAAETGLFDCISHPDLIKNETAKHWDPRRIWDDILRSLDRIAATGVAMELNTSGVLKRIPQMNPFPAMLVEMRRRAIPVVIGADAHVPQRVADGFVEALGLLDQCGYTQVSYFLERQRREIEIDAALATLSGRNDASIAAS